MEIELVNQTARIYINKNTTIHLEYRTIQFFNFLLPHAKMIDNKVCKNKLNQLNQLVLLYILKASHDQFQACVAERSACDV